MTNVEQIAKQEALLLQAMLMSDVKALDTLISEELIFTDHTGQLISKTADIEAHRSGKLAIEIIEPSEQLIKVHHNTAVVSVLKFIKGKYSGQPFQGTIRYTRIWIKVDSSWKVMAGHATTVNN